MATVQALATSQPSRLLAGRAILRRAFSFPVFLGALLVGGTFVGARANLADPDTWWHITVGKQILSEWRWPTTDPYSFTVSGTHWMAYEWLGEVVMALAARSSGLRGPTALLVALSGTLLLLLYYYAYLRCGNAKAAFVACTLVLPVAAAFFTLRPQLFGYVFLLITLICLEHFRRGSGKILWILPVVFLLWVNTHGSFAFGLFVLGVSWMSGLVELRRGGLVAERWSAEQRRQLAWVMLLCVLVLPLTPYGSRMAAYPLEMSLSQPINIANIQEWQPLGFELYLGKLFLGLLLVFFLAQVISPLTYRLADVALLLFAVYAACTHLRFVLLFVLIFTPLLAVLLSRWVPGYRAARDRFVLNGTLLVLIGGGLVAFFPSNHELQRIAGQRYPRDAVAYLRTHPVAGPMLNEYGWGGYLIWALGPTHKVFIDGRADIYEYGGVLEDYLHIVRLDPNALPLLRKYGIEACLIARKAPLATLLASQPDWERVYADEVAAVYVHKQRHLAGAPVSPRVAEPAGSPAAPPTKAHSLLQNLFTNGGSFKSRAGLPARRRLFSAGIA